MCVRLCMHFLVQFSHFKTLTAIDNGEQVQVYRENSRGQAKRDGPPVWGLGVGLIISNRKKPACYEMVHRASDGRLNDRTSRTFSRDLRNVKVSIKPFLI